MPRVVDQAELEALGTSLAHELRPGAVVWLEGELGAGKTTLAQVIVRALGGTSRATSPTYALVHRYETPGGPIYHIDCYRLRDPEEAADLDWAGLVSGRALLVEWPERAAGWVPPFAWRVRLEHIPDRPDRRAVTARRAS